MEVRTVRWDDVWRELVAEDPELGRAYRNEFPYGPVADAIVGLRARMHLTQAQLAERMQTSQSAIARAESGKHPVNTEFLRRMAAALGVDWRVYFGDKDDAKRPEAAAISP